MSDDDDKPVTYGAYGMMLMDPWSGPYAKECITHLNELFEDLRRWKALVEDGRGDAVIREIDEVLIKAAQPGPIEKMLEGNCRFTSQSQQAK